MFGHEVGFKSRVSLRDLGLIAAMAAQDDSKSLRRERTSVRFDE